MRTDLVRNLIVTIAAAAALIATESSSWADCPEAPCPSFGSEEFWDLGSSPPEPAPRGKRTTSYGVEVGTHQADVTKFATTFAPLYAAFTVFGEGHVPTTAADNTGQFVDTATVDGAYIATAAGTTLPGTVSVPIPQGPPQTITPNGQGSKGDPGWTPSIR